MKKDDKLHAKYEEKIEALVTKGFAKKVSEDNSSEGRTWYIPHHGVTNVNKPDKLRVVFDCSASYGGISLNEAVYQGPDLTNKLVGVLVRFREKEFGMMSDIEAMYHQISVPPRDIDALRFLWWQDGDSNQQVQIYGMTRHLFGGI